MLHDALARKHASRIEDVRRLAHPRASVQTFDALDLMSLPNRDFHLRLMIDGAPSKPFGARTLEQRGGVAG